MKKKSLFKRGLIFALSLSVILPQNSMNLMAAETENTEVLENVAEENTSAESLQDTAIDEVQATVAAEKSVVDHYYYIESYDRRYDSLVDVPCLNHYYEIYVYDDGSTLETLDLKMHMFIDTYTDEQGNELVDFDPNPDNLPCGFTYTLTSVCETCGYIHTLTFIRNHYPITDHIYTTEDGTIYAYDGDIPCGTHYIESFVCTRCGETITDEGTTPCHCWVDSDDGKVCANCGKSWSDVYNTLKITSQPEDQTVVVGNSFSFKVAATGSGMTYLWQYSTDGAETWIDTTRTRDNYGTTATAKMDGRMFRCVITDEDGYKIISSPATLTVKPAISITAQPSSVTVNAGEKYSFKVTAKSNTGSKLTYLWQYSKTLKGWTDTTRTLNNYGTTATVGVDGKYFRCKITDEAGNVVYSEPAMVRVQSEITITKQPANTTVANGKRYYFTVTATGASLAYKWEYSKDGGNTWIETTRTKNNYTTYAKKAMNGWLFRCVITDSSNNSVTTEAGKLTVK